MTFDRSYLIVKLAAAGDVLLTTALARALRRACPQAAIGWLTSGYAAPLLEANPDIDEILTAPTSTAAAWHWLAPLRRWQLAHPDTTVLLAHRSARLALLLRAAGFSRVVGFEHDCWWARNLGLTAAVRFDPKQHRLQQQAELLRAAGIACEGLTSAPRLRLQTAELEAGERIWHEPRSVAAGLSPRWVIAPGGASNPWSAMPNRRWAPERFLELGRRALAAGVALRWLGGDGDQPLLDWIAARLPEGEASLCAGLPLRQAAAVIAWSDLVIGNDSLALVMAQALKRPCLGLYGPTDGARIHAPGQPFAQGHVACGPCYDPRDGTRGLAYSCPRAQCMERLTVAEVWSQALAAGYPAWRKHA